MKKRTHGYTLTEIMITVAILGVVATAGPNILTGVTKFSRLSQARLETQRNARDALNQVNQTLRQATGSTIVVTQQSGQPPSSSISFTTVDGRNLSFYQSGKTFFFVNNGSTRTVCDGLRYIAFTYPRTDDSTIMSVSLTFEKDTYQGGTKALQMAIEKVRIMD